VTDTSLHYYALCRHTTALQPLRAGPGDRCVTVIRAVGRDARRVGSVRAAGWMIADRAQKSAAE